ncbi:hypothetical protein V9T40_000273 [Parthenolecanium corni]|uniref:INO80 complex subunit B-like conserved region domain-containing protein n=1 Tax=Parthenolecanium corni TaxID=536013 RepID=A0AAN9Y0C4_9HEMI
MVCLSYCIGVDTDTEDRKLKPSKLRKKRVTEDLNNVLDSTFLNDEGNNFPSDVSSQNCSVISNDFQTEYSDISNKVGESPRQNAKKKKTKNKDDEDGCSSEEERWLHAIESGKLDEVDDELKKIKPKDPKLMTARQRAMLERKTDKDGTEQLLSLPSGYREKVITPEMLEEKAKKLQKRKQLADEKRENDKKKTMERLLKKSESKSVKIGQKQRGFKKSVPHVIYMSSINMNSVSMPPNVPFPLDIPCRKIKSMVFCGREGCGNLKRYSVSKSGIPVCSLACYKAVGN